MCISEAYSSIPTHFFLYVSAAWSQCLAIYANHHMPLPACRAPEHDRYWRAVENTTRWSCLYAFWEAIIEKNRNENIQVKTINRTLSSKGLINEDTTGVLFTTD
jgi:hypothetical protein